MTWTWESELPALSDKTDQETADAINAITSVTMRPLTSHELLAWASINGRLARIKRLISEGADDVTKTLAETCYLAIVRESAVIDPNNETHAAGMQACISKGVLTTEEVAELAAMASSTGPKYATVYAGQVAEARRAAQ